MLWCASKFCRLCKESFFCGGQGVSLLAQKAMEENRPSLLLQRMGEEGLWNLAKASGSTVDAIRQANGLQDEPVPGQMLLIPVICS